MTITKETKRKIVDSTLVELKNKLSDDTVVGRYKEIGQDVDIETISTGSLAVDNVIGGGIPKGKLTQIVGKTSSGKTTLALTAIAELQKEDPEAVIMFVDAELALDPKYAAQLGVNMNSDGFILVQPMSGEEGFEAVQIFIESGIADLVVIDSIASMRPQAILDTKLGDTPQVASMARMVGSAVQKIYRVANKHKTTVIMLNQLTPMVRTSQYQVTGNTTFGQFYTPGGEQLPFYCSQILKISRGQQVKEGDVVVSNVVQMECVKNKIAPPFQKAEFYITFGKGVDRIQEVIGLGRTTGVVEVKNNRLYSIPEFIKDGTMEKPINGRMNFVKFLEDNPELLKRAQDLNKEAIKGANEIRIIEEPVSADESLDEDIQESAE